MTHRKLSPNCFRIVYIRVKKVAEERKYELENTPDEQDRKKKMKEWQDEAGLNLFFKINLHL